MPSGTVLNGVFASRIHKSNARQVAEDARDTKEYIRSQLLCLVAATPTPEEKEMLVTHVYNMVAELNDATLTEWMATYVAENPDDCEDELE